MARREYQGGAIAATLGAGINSTDLTITLSASPGATNWPTGAVGKFGFVIGRGTANEEKVYGLSRTGTTITVSSTSDRGVDGSTAVAHTAGETVEHVMFAADLDEANSHVSNPGLVGVISASAPADTAAAGTSDAWARADHRHARETTPASIPTFTARHSSNQSFASSVTPAVVSFNTEIVDTHSGHSNSSNPSRFTIPSNWAGTWFVSAQIEWASNATGFRIVQIVKNGTTALLEADVNPNATQAHFHHIAGLVGGLVAGDYLEVFAAQNSGGALNLLTATAPLSPYFTAHWVHS